MSEGPQKTALVLCGGGFGGFCFETGVIAALEAEAEGRGRALRFDLIVGTSAGAVLGVLLAAGYSARDILQANRDPASDHVLHNRQDKVMSIAPSVLLRGAMRGARAGLRSWRGRRAGLGELLVDLWSQRPAGLFTQQPLVKSLKKALKARGVPDDFAALPIPLRITAYDVRTCARAVFPDPRRLGARPCEAAAASGSVPVFFPPTRIARADFIDAGLGGVAHLDVPVEEGARHILVAHVAVQATAPKAAASAEAPAVEPGELGFVPVFLQVLRIMTEARFPLEVAMHRADHPDIPLIVASPLPGTMPPENWDVFSVEAVVGTLEAGETAGRRLLEEQGAELAPFFRSPS